MLPPGPDRSPRVWELAALRRDPLRYFAELRRHGEVAHVAVRAAGVLLVRITLVQDPALIKKILVDDDACFEKPRALKKLKVLLGEGLLTSEGEHHRRQRRLMQPAFHRDAVLGRLLAAEDEGKAGMTEQQVRDEAITLFLAGHETTALALAWTFYLLAGHPEALAVVHAELDAVLAVRLPTADELPRLVHT